MSLGYPAVRPKPEGQTHLTVKEGPYGVPDTMLHGLHTVRQDVSTAHPLEFSESEWTNNQQKMDFAMLRNIQGVHAPLRLQMERTTAKKVGRLPCLSSSNVMYDTLTGRDSVMGFEDILNIPADSEISVNPHLAAEKRDGLL